MQDGSFFAVWSRFFSPELPLQFWSAPSPQPCVFVLSKAGMKLICGAIYQGG